MGTETQQMTQKKEIIQMEMEQVKRERLGKNISPKPVVHNK